MPDKIPSYRPPVSGNTRASYEKSPERAERNAFYWSVRWRKLSASVRKAEPLCRLCVAEGRTEIAVCVDHIEPRDQRPDLAFERSNLRPLCQRHHGTVRADQRR